MADQPRCVRCEAELPVWARRCPNCGYRPPLPTWVRIATVALGLVAAIAGLVTLGAFASIVAGDTSVTTIAGAVVFAAATIGAGYGIVYLRSSAGGRASDPPP